MQFTWGEPVMQQKGLMKKLVRIANNPPPTLSKEAKKRLSWLDWHRAHGCNVSLSARHFHISRSTVYRWLCRYDRYRLETLESKGRKPKRKRRPTWSYEQVIAVKELREQYPRWGKAKLKVLLTAKGILMSESMVGRILKYLKQSGQLKEPLGLVRTKSRSFERSYGIRKPKDYRICSPGDLVQIDTLEVKPLHQTYKHFSMVDMVSRWGMMEIRSRATSRCAKESLARMLSRAPFQIKAIQVDGGSEFRAEFEEYCQQKKIKLFVLPPRSPKLNGQVERIQWTHTREFYQCYDCSPDLPSIQKSLANWEVIYNTIRPHESLRQMTPQRFLEQNHQDLLGVKTAC